MKDNYPDKDQFPDREDARKHLREGSLPKDYENFDAFSRRAFRGLQSMKSEEALQASLHRLDQRFERTITRRPQPKGLAGILGIAAAILIVVATAASLIWWQQPATVPDTAELFAEHFAPVPSAIPMSGTLRGAERATDLKRIGIKAYEAANYEKAVHAFEDYLQQQPGDTEVRFYFGVALLAGNNRAAAAIDQLSIVYQEPPRPAYRTAAAWYLGLANLKAGQQQQVIRYLQELARDHDSDYQGQAIKLLKQLGHDVSSADTTRLPGLGSQLPPAGSASVAPFF